MSAVTLRSPSMKTALSIQGSRGLVSRLNEWVVNPYGSTTWKGRAFRFPPYTGCPGPIDPKSIRLPTYISSLR